MTNRTHSACTRLEIPCRYNVDGSHALSSGLETIDPAKDPRRASSESLESRMGYLATNIEIRPLQLDIVLKNIGVNWEATMNHYFQTVHHVRGSRELSG